MISRRNFVSRIAQGLGLSLLWPSVSGCRSDAQGFQPQLTGPNFTLGHRLRTMDFTTPTETYETDIVIAGGGVSGLSAARYLKESSTNFILLEMGDEPGGNALGGSNSVSEFPWGAHYLPLPGDGDPELTKFLRECNVITGYQNGLPVYNEYYLCFDPKERLYINHYWQEGILPHEGVPKKDREELDRFTSLMHEYKIKKGKDGLDAFTIPLSNSSNDPELMKLDEISMDDFLLQQNFQSPYLKWYVNYCCADDYGSSTAETSAWAGIHYFASRKNAAANASSDSVLTWPEGNYWLVKQLKKSFNDTIRSKSLVYSVTEKDNHVEVLYFDAATNTTKKVLAKAAILATPQFINQRITHSERKFDYTSFQYAPWMVANLTLKSNLNERHGEPLSWDNVIYGSRSLGYVNATHQHLNSSSDQHVITYYQPLPGSAAEIRRQAQQTPAEVWSQQILRDLKQPHPKIEKHIQEMNIWIWGHGMIKPIPGFIWGNNRKAATTSLPGQRIHFAHSDLSGISIFEEAFYQGHRAAQAVLQAV